MFSPPGGLRGRARAACTPAPPARSSGPGSEPFGEQTARAGEADGPAGFIGVLARKEQAEVSAPFTTTVKECLVNVGDRVAVGAKLGSLAR